MLALEPGEFSAVSLEGGGDRLRFRQRPFQLANVTLHSREERLHLVIILLPDDVVFVIVAARATERDAEKHRAYRVDGIVQKILTLLLRLLRHAIP